MNRFLCVHVYISFVFFVCVIRVFFVLFLLCVSFFLCMFRFLFVYVCFVLVFVLRVFRACFHNVCISFFCDVCFVFLFLRCVCVCVFGSRFFSFVLCVSPCFRVSMIC